MSHFFSLLTPQSLLQHLAILTRVWTLMAEDAMHGSNLLIRSDTELIFLCSPIQTLIQEPSVASWGSVSCLEPPTTREVDHLLCPLSLCCPKNFLLLLIKLLFIVLFSLLGITTGFSNLFVPVSSPSVCTVEQVVS